MSFVVSIVARSDSSSARQLNGIMARVMARPRAIHGRASRRVHNSAAFLGLLFLAAPFDALRQASKCVVATPRGTFGAYIL